MNLVINFIVLFILGTKWRSSNCFIEDIQQLIEEGIKELNVSNSKEKNLVGDLSEFDASNLTSIEFYLWTQQNVGNETYFTLELGNSTNLKQSYFNGSLKTFLLFHGFGSYGTDQWILETKNKLLGLYDCNVIAVDYSQLARKPHYLQAVMNSYSVSFWSASFVDWLCKSSTLTPSNLHLIGFSLGAHVAGVAALSATSGKVGRVTGLDPAAPFFSSIENTKHRLSSSAAEFVDVIHTSGCLEAPQSIGEHINCLGLSEAVGHVDFYPNGGLFQPGCNNSDFRCSHLRALDLWTESISTRPLDFLSMPCSDGKRHHEGMCQTCGQGCLTMGFGLNTTLKGKYFLETNSNPPFAKSIC